MYKGGRVFDWKEKLVQKMKQKWQRICSSTAVVNVSSHVNKFKRVKWISSKKPKYFYLFFKKMILLEKNIFSFERDVQLFIK
jgi:hypothetical protein